MTLSRPAAAPGSVRLLKIVVGVVLCIYGAELAVQQLHSAHRGHDSVFHFVLGVAESIAALLFLLWPRSAGVALLLIIAVAAGFHLLHGQMNGIGALAIYAVAVFTVMNST